MHFQIKFINIAIYCNTFFDIAIYRNTFFGLQYPALIKIFGGVFVLSWLSSCHRTELSQIFSFFSWICFMIISNGSISALFLLSRLRKVSYLAVSVRLTVKQVWVNECVVQYNWSMIFKGQSNDAMHNRYVITKTTQERLLKRTLHT